MLMRLQAKILLGATILAASVPASAQQPNPLKREMRDLESQIQRVATTNPARASRLKARLQQVRDALYGSTTTAPVIAPATPSTAGGAQNAVAPPYAVFGPCGASTTGTPGTTVVAAGVGGLPITDYLTTIDTALVSGLGTQTFDVDLTVAITHTWASDMLISLTSPAGTTVPVSTARGGSYDNVFNGTLFDDQSANSVVTYPYVSGSAAPDLMPEASFNLGFAGENPNGLWTLQIYDQYGGDTGMLNSWSVAVTDGTVVVVPPSFGPTSTYSTGPIADAIMDYTTTYSPLTISGASTSLASVECYVEITHTWSSDMLIQLQSPAGTVVDLSNHWGGSYNDVFNGTLFSMSSANPIASYVFTDLVAAPDLRPDGDLNLFAGEDANGTWNLVVYDAYGGDIGYINRWDLKVTECGATTPVSYCTAGTTSNGCNATVSATNNPSMTAAQCQITVANVEGQQSGIIFYGLAQSGTPWGVGGNSFLCVKAPLERTGVQFSNGTLGACDGSLVLDWDLFQASTPGATGQPWTAGAKAYVQGWFRDPPAVKTTSLSNGLELTYLP